MTNPIAMHITTVSHAAIERPSLRFPRLRTHYYAAGKVLIDGEAVPVVVPVPYGGPGSRTLLEQRVRVTVEVLSAGEDGR